MRLALLLVCCLAAVAAASRTAPSIKDFLAAQGTEEEGQLWALLIAGSAGWGNYRHQADVAHAYQVLRHGGLHPDRIVTMVFDDIADNPMNPHPGQLFNAPKGEDVYAGIVIDYAGAAVNAKQFLAVLAGNVSLAEPGRNGKRKVLATGPEDRIFVYYSDHGAPGILGMPSGPFLYADQLHEVLANKSRHGGFKEMVLYIEACESGSMFEGLLEDDLQVYATTAANGHESSWGTYCPGMNPSPPPEFDTCLGDLYSVAWLENSDAADLTVETLKKQFQLVKARTSQNFTFMQGSHAMRFGTLDIAEEPAAEFLGEGNTGAHGANGADGAQAAWARVGALPQRDADLHHLYIRYTRAEGAAKAAALRALDAEVSRRAGLDASVRASVTALLRSSCLLDLVRARYGRELQTAEGGRLPLAGGEASAQGLLDVLVHRALPRAPGLPLVDDWGCLRGMVDAWEEACGPLDQYGMRHTRAFANLCNAGLAPPALRAAAAASCSSAPAARLVGPHAAQA
eukprot:scaffold20.g7632.t1